MRSGVSLRTNLIFNAIDQVIVVFTPLVIAPKLSRIFGSDYLGLKSYTFSIVYYFAIFGLLGLDMYGQRKIAIEKDDIAKRSQTFWTIFSAKLVLCFISLLLYTMYYNMFSSSSFEKTVFACWSFYLIREMINPIWFLQGMERFKFLSIFNIMSQISYLVLTFVFITEKAKLPLYILFYTCVPLFISICYLPVVFKNVVPCKVKVWDAISIVKKSIVFFIPTVAIAVYSMVDKTMLGAFDKSMVSTGLYEAAEKLVKVALAFSTASFTIIRTRMSYLYGKNDNRLYDSYCKTFISLSMLLCFPIMFGVIGISKDFVPIFFGPGFEAVIKLSYVFSLVIPCLTLSGLMQAIFIFPYGLQKEMNIYYCFILATNVFMNVILINRYDTLGAIIASICTEFLLACILVVKARKDIPVSHIFKVSIKYFIAALAMLGMIISFSLYVSCNPILKIIAEVFIGCVSYFLFCIILRDSFVIDNIKRFFCNRLKDKKG